MSVLQLADFKKAFEDKFGVTAAAPMMMGGMSGGGGRGADGVRRRARGRWRQEDPGHQGGARGDGSRPQGGEGPGGRRSQGGQGQAFQGRGGRAQEAPRGGWRSRRDQVAGDRIR